MQSLQQLRVPLYAVIFSPHTKNSDRMSLDVSDTYWATMEAICPVLEPLAEATELLAMASSPTLSCVHVLLKSLLEALNCTPGEAKVASDLKKMIQNGLKKRFNLTADGLPSDASITTPAMMATTLDPRYKTLQFLPEEKRTRVSGAVEVLLDDHAETTDQEDLPVPVSALAVKQESYNSPSKKLLLSCVIGDVDLTQGNDTSVSQEEHTGMQLWVFPTRSYGGKYTAISSPTWIKLGHKYLGIPATEVPSKRAFSAARQTITTLRASLDPETVDSTLFIKNNNDSSCFFVFVEAKNNTATETSGNKHSAGAGCPFAPHSGLRPLLCSYGHSIINFNSLCPSKCSLNFQKCSILQSWICVVCKSTFNWLNIWTNFDIVMDICSISVLLLHQDGTITANEFDMSVP